jgi:hypothetical protein
MPNTQNSGMDVSLQDQKTIEEIRTLKLKYRLAVLGIIGTILAFIVGNLTDIKAIFYPPPAIKIVTSDTFLKTHGVLMVYSSSEPDSPVMQTSVSEANDWLTLKPGAYRVVVQLNNIRRLDEHVVLENGDKEPLLIEHSYSQIQLKVVNETPEPYPGSVLRLRVESSGNGYLWIYELLNNNQFRRHYPPVGVVAERHSIYAGKPFTLPDEKNYGLRAGNKEGQENLLFVVTSTHDVTIADAIAARMANATTKASGGDVQENWGIYLLSYQVEL